MHYTCYCSAQTDGDVPWMWLPWNHLTFTVRRVLPVLPPCNTHGQQPRNCHQRQTLDCWQTTCTNCVLFSRQWKQSLVVFGMCSIAKITKIWCKSAIIWRFLWASAIKWRFRWISPFPHNSAEWRTSGKLKLCPYGTQQVDWECKQGKRSKRKAADSGPFSGIFLCSLIESLPLEWEYATEHVRCNIPTAVS